jgi:hypothetical protein
MKEKKVTKIISPNFHKSIFHLLDKEVQKRILLIQSDIEQRLVNIKTDIYGVGKLLSCAKKILPWGTFQRWIEETFGNDLPYSTAACWKSIYEVFEKNPQSVKLIPMNFLIKMKEKSFPEEILRLANENPEAFKEADLEELSRAYADFKNNEIYLDDFVELAKKQIKLGMAIISGENRLRHAQRANRTIKQGFYDLTKAVKKMRKYSNEIRRFFVFPQEAGMIDEIRDHNLKVYMIDDSLDDKLIEEINLCIRELENLREDIYERCGLFKIRLRATHGVIRPTWIDAESGKRI